MQLRVFEIAKQTGKNATEIREELKKRSVEVKSNLSLVDPKVAKEIIDHFAGGPAKASEPAKAAPAKHEPKHAGDGHVTPAPAAKPAVDGAVPHAPAKAAAPAAPKPAPVAPKPEAQPAPVAPKATAAPAPAPAKPAAPAPVAPAKPAPAAAAAAAPAVSRPAAPAPVKPPVQAPAAQRPAAPVAAKPAPAPAKPAEPAKADKSPGKPAPAPAAGPKPAPAAATAAPAGVPAAEAPVVEAEKKIIKLPESVTVAELAERMGVKAVDVIKKLMEYKIMATMNQKLDKDAAQTVALDFGFETELMGLYGEDLLEREEEDNPANVVPRPPVVTIMGHVDHGKTSLLDAIRSTNVAAGESGGITQHIGAYKVSLPGKGDVVFLDTPGHAAFTSMRARGAKVTDVVVLVVAADDGVMPQTVEAIDHAKAAGVPILVAINKIDKEGAKPERVMQELSKYNLVPEEWGGKTIYTQISAKKRIGLEKLLELLLLEASLLELKADPKRRGKGVVIEAKLDKGRGVVSTVLVQKGSVKVGEIFVSGNHFGRVRALVDDKGKKVEEAGPATPVEILGFSGLPAAGDGFQIVENERLARQISGKRMEAQKERERDSSSHIKLDDLFNQIKTGDLKELKVIVKADVSGSSEAIKESLEKIESNKVKVRVIHAGVGNINENDLLLAAASNAIILGFHTKAEGKATELARSEQVDVRLYNVIYDLVNDVKGAMEGLLEPKYTEVVTGKGDVRGVFKTSAGPVAGTYITSGKVTRANTARLYRGTEKLWEGKITSLKRFKDDAKEVAANLECGIALDGVPEIQVGDQLEFITTESVAQKL